MKKYHLFSTILLSLSSFAQVHTESCHALKQSQSSLVISDVESGTDDFDVNYYHLDLEASNSNTLITGSVVSKATALDNVDTMWFHLVDGMNISSCKVNDVVYSNYIRLNNLVLIPLQNSITSGGSIDMEINYDGDAGGTGFFSGYSSQTNGFGKEVSWTLSEPFNAKTWFPVKEDLTDKIDSVQITITSPSSTFAGSNGLLQSSTILGNGKVKNVWKTNYLIDFYLIAFAIADYEEYSYKTLIPGTTDSLLMQNFIYDVNYSGQPLVDYSKPFMDEMGDMMDIFSDKFGIYPFINEKYGIMQAPMGGGMEHQTMTTQAYVSNVGLTAHELGHQWWGDHVTCSNWNDIWLNEGFATYSEYVYFEASGQTAIAANDLFQNQQSARQSASGSVYVPDGSSDSRIFSSILTYSKGMAVVHMLRYVLGDDFFPFLKHYQNSNAFGNSTTEEFTALLNAYTGQDLTWFIDEWIYGKGYPKYNVKWKQATDGVLWVDIDETPSSSDYFSMYLPLRLHFDDGTTEDIHFRPEEGMANIFSSYSSSKTITLIELDPDSWILKGTSSITENFPIGVSEIEQSISIQSNPSSLLSIHNTSDLNISVKVLDLQSKAHFTTSISANAVETISKTKSLQNGVYLLSFQSEDGHTFTKKWMKN